MTIDRVERERLEQRIWLTQHAAEQPGGMREKAIHALIADLDAAERERDHLREFKRLVHERLDYMGIQPHAEKPCRVGARLAEAGHVIEELGRSGQELMEDVQRLTAERDDLDRLVQCYKPTAERIERERDAIAADADALFGPGWQESLKTVGGQPHDALAVQLTKMVAERDAARQQVERLRKLLERSHFRRFEIEAALEEVPCDHTCWHSVRENGRSCKCGHLMFDPGD